MFAAGEIVLEKTITHEHAAKGNGNCYEPIYHVHSGSSSNGGGCYVPVYHTHSPACVHWFNHINVGQTMVCELTGWYGVGCGYNDKSYYCGGCYDNSNWICGNSGGITGYTLGCGKTPSTIESWNLI